MQRIVLCTFIVFLLFCSTVPSACAHQEVRSTLGSATLFSQSPPSTSPPGVGTPEAKALSILSPLPGQALQGNVPILARSTIQDFVSLELSFSYFNNPTGVWFLIYQGNQPVMGSALAQWDTSTITDGEYTLRLVVYFKDGSQQTASVPGLRVRNYTPIETDTPSAGALTETSIYNQGSIETQAPMSMLISPTVTPFPSNPAEINQKEVFDGVLRGALVVLGLFALGILYRSVRSFFRNRSNL